MLGLSQRINAYNQSLPLLSLRLLPSPSPSLFLHNQPTAPNPLNLSSLSLLLLTSLSISQFIAHAQLSLSSLLLARNTIFW
jgi:hypothetical protein